MNLIRVKAFADAKKFHIEETEHQKIRIFVREAAQNNQANKKILASLAEFYEIPQNKLKMISGHQSPNKIIQILE